MGQVCCNLAYPTACYRLGLPNGTIQPGLVPHALNSGGFLYANHEMMALERDFQILTALHPHFACPKVDEVNHYRQQAGLPPQSYSECRARLGLPSLPEATQAEERKIDPNDGRAYTFRDW